MVIYSSRSYTCCFSLFVGTILEDVYQNLLDSIYTSQSYTWCSSMFVVTVLEDVYRNVLDSFLFLILVKVLLVNESHNFSLTISVG